MSGSDQRPSLRLGAAVLYALAIAYGTLYPLTGWQLSFEDLGNLVPSWHDRLSRTDMLTNVLLYMPFGGLVVFGLIPRLRPLTALSLAALAGTSLSLSLEMLQQGIPGRVASLSDLVLNAGGTILGAVAIAALAPSLPMGGRLLRLKRRWIASGPDADVGLAAIALWALSQLSPLVPSADLGHLRDGLRPLWATLRHLERFDLHDALAYFAAVCGIGLLASTVVRRRRPLIVAFGVLVGVVLLLKVPVITRQLSLEALLGSSAGYLLFVTLRRARGGSRQTAALGLLLGAYVLDGLRLGSGSLSAAALDGINLVPFADYRLNLYDLPDILGAAWVPLALAYLLRRDLPKRKSRALALGGAVFVFGIAFALEWAQQSIPGRTADLTDCLVAVAAWLAPWMVRGRSRPAERRPGGARVEARGGARPPR